MKFINLNIVFVQIYRLGDKKVWLKYHYFITNLLSQKLNKFIVQVSQCYFIIFIFSKRIIYVLGLTSLAFE